MWLEICIVSCFILINIGNSNNDYVSKSLGKTSVTIKQLGRPTVIRNRRSNSEDTMTSSVRFIPKTGNRRVFVAKFSVSIHVTRVKTSSVEISTGLFWSNARLSRDNRDYMLTLAALSCVTEKNERGVGYQHL